MKYETMTSVALAALAVTLPVAAGAQTSPAPMSEAEVQALPPEYRTGPAVADYSDVTVDEYGVETVTRTRRIESAAPYQAQHESESYNYRYAQPVAYGQAPAGAVFSRDEWIEECEDRTNGRGDSEKGGIIGGLLGAITGGIVGNRVAGAGERLGGTLIGAGVGGIAGVVLGSLIGGGRNDRGEYDCEAALDGYLTQYGHPGAYRPGTYRVASRVIAAPAYAPAYAPPPAHHGYGYAPAYQYSYAPPQQVVYVPVEYEVQQRVIVRETVREEVIPGAARSIPPAPRPAPQPVYVKQSEPRYIKGN